MIDEALLDKLMMADGAALKAAREKLDLSQAELAQMAGTNQQTIDRLERGLTRRSKFVPAIRAALGLPAVEPETGMLPFAGKYESGYYGVRARIAEDYMDPQKLPVFSLERKGEDWVVSEEPDHFIPRVYPVHDVITAYGIVVPDEDMAPSLRKGQIAVINPDHSGESWSNDVFLVRALPSGRIAGLFRAWYGFEGAGKEGQGFDSGSIKVAKWNPQTVEYLPHLVWPAFGAVVAKIRPPR